jgi:DNA-binding response OmpR family regulator
MNANILYVEDDTSLSFITIDQLTEAGFEVSHCEDGKKALELFENEYFDIAILDIMLPYVDGFTIAEKIRAKNEDIPIIFLSAKSMEEDRLRGFKLGADDYLVKPFSMEELIFKIKVFLKRKTIHQLDNEAEYKIGVYQFSPSKLNLQLDQNSRELTAKEAALLLMFIENENKTIKREDILLKLWGKNDYFLGRSLDVFIARLRKYLVEDESIQLLTVRGIGFRMEIN